jgi:hypothetical protein
VIMERVETEGTSASRDDEQGCRTAGSTMRYLLTIRHEKNRGPHAFVLTF